MNPVEVAGFELTALETGGLDDRWVPPICRSACPVCFGSFRALKKLFSFKKGLEAKAAISFLPKKRAGQVEGNEFWTARSQILLKTEILPSLGDRRVPLQLYPPPR